MENREALIKIGFGGNLEPIGRIDTEAHRIYVDRTDLSFSVLEIETNRKILEGFPKDIEQLKKLCSPYVDFTEKPKYDWETVKSKMGGRCKLHLGYIINTLNAGTDEGVLSKEEAQSMIAKLKLNIVIQQIDEDYPNGGADGSFYGHIFCDREKKIYIEPAAYKPPLSVVMESEEGAQILLDQNTQLLKNLFKLETDATGED